MSPVHTLLLTGVPGIGKTTVMKKVAARLPGRRIRGFVTGEIRQSGRRVGFELATFDGQTAVLAHVDIASPHRVSRYGVDTERLDAIVEEALALDDATDLYLVDEIGKMECFSEKFCRAVRALADSSRPLVATVALRGSGFIRQVKQRADVELWALTRQNRDDMPDRIVRWLGGR